MRAIKETLLGLLVMTIAFTLLAIAIIYPKAGIVIFGVPLIILLLLIAKGIGYRILNGDK